MESMDKQMSAKKPDVSIKASNENFAELLEAAGVEIILGVPGLKVHCKICLALYPPRGVPLGNKKQEFVIDVSRSHRWWRMPAGD